MHISKFLLQVLKHSSRQKLHSKEHIQIASKTICTTFHTSRRELSIGKTLHHELNSNIIQTNEIRRTLKGSIKCAYEDLNDKSLDIIVNRLNDSKLCNKKIDFVSQTDSSFASIKLIFLIKLGKVI